MPPSTAARTVAIASSRSTDPHTLPMPPPPRVNALTSPSLPNGLFCISTACQRRSSIDMIDLALS
jgi:hypothetical protein